MTEVTAGAAPGGSGLGAVTAGAAADSAGLGEATTGGSPGGAGGGERERVAPAVLVMARAPQPGQVKTRLQPAFSPEECAEIQRVLVRRTAAWAVDVAGAGAAYVAHHPPQGWGDLARLVPAEVEPIAQRGGDLGERLANAVGEVFERAAAHDSAPSDSGPRDPAPSDRARRDHAPGDQAPGDQAPRDDDAAREPGASPGGGPPHGPGRPPPSPAARPLLVVGVDTRLTKQHADDALERLDAGADVVFGPALDGGYYLVAMKRPQRALFDLPPQGWGGPDVLARSLAAARAAGLSTALLQPERDLDTPADARALAEHDPELAPLLRRQPLVSVVIPTRDEATALPQTLDHLAELPGRFEVTVVDGGSTDQTRQLAAKHPLKPRLLHQDGGRAAQLNAGARASSGDPIVFLHADTRLPRSAYDSLTATAAAGGNFAIRFEGDDLFARLLGAWYRAQRRLGVYYGDSAIWLRRETFDRLRGFDTSLPIMDDYELARRLERNHSTACLPGPVTTSSRRWRALGVPRTVLAWVVIRWLFIAGVSPERLARLYRPARVAPGTGTAEPPRPAGRGKLLYEGLRSVRRRD